MVAETLRRSGCNPFEILADLAVNPLLEPAVRVRAASELAGYIAPKLKAIEVSETSTVVQVHPIDLSRFQTETPRAIPDAPERPLAMDRMPGSVVPEDIVPVE